MAGISPRTMVRWLTLPYFRDELRRAGIDASQAIVGATMRRLTEGQAAALDVLNSVMKRGKPNERRLAATSWMTIYRDLKELQDFEDRLSRLEKELTP
jgi:transcriptional regulator NrdR family protein